MANDLYGSRRAADYQSQQRAVIVALKLHGGAHLTTREIAEMVGLTYQGARAMMEAISGERVPVTRDEDTGKWFMVVD